MSAVKQGIFSTDVANLLLTYLLPPKSQNTLFDFIAKPILANNNKLLRNAFLRHNGSLSFFNTLGENPIKELKENTENQHADAAKNTLKHFCLG
jgi:hypothetical protein